MMDILPKVLVKELEQLCEKDILSSWNIGSYNNMTTVSITFMKPGHIGSPPVTGMRRKSQSLTKTKTHVSNAQLTSDNDHGQHCDSNSESMPTLQVDSVQDST